MRTLYLVDLMGFFYGLQGVFRAGILLAHLVAYFSFARIGDLVAVITYAVLAVLFLLVAYGILQRNAFAPFLAVLSSLFFLGEAMFIVGVAESRPVLLAVHVLLLFLVPIVFSLGKDTRRVFFSTRLSNTRPL